MTVWFARTSRVFATRRETDLILTVFLLDDDDDADDDLGEIDLDNVVGRRTRGRVIDFAKAAEENPADEDEDEDEDDDFEDPDEKMDED